MRPATDTDFLTKTELAKRHIQTLVLSGVYQPGDRITTREVARALGISDTPIREAVQSLASEGWLDVQQHVGAVVQGVTAEQIREVSRLRGSVSAIAIEISATVFDDIRIKAIEENLEGMQRALESDDRDSFAERNYEFHDLICDKDHAPWCRRFLDNLYGHMSPGRLGITPTKDRMAAALQEHRDVLEKLRARDFKEAARLVDVHERNAGDFFLEFLNQN